MKQFWLMSFVGAACGFIGATVLAQQDKVDAKPEPKSAAKPVTEKPATNAPDGSDADEEAMAAWVKLSEPSEFHARLKPLAGMWNTVMKSRMSQDAPWDEAKGTAEYKWILGGRFLTQEFKGTFTDFPFEGFGIWGYDSVARHYTSVWMDTFGTTIMVSTGTCDESGKTFTVGGEYNDAASGGKRKYKFVLRIVSNDQHVLEMNEMGPDGKEFKGLEVTYTRK